MGNVQDIYQAAKHGNLPRLQLWIKRYPKCIIRVLVNRRSEGQTPLTIACQKGHLDVVEYLVDVCGADIEKTGWINEAEIRVNGAPPLWWATHAGHLSVARSLVTRGADVNCKTRNRITPLIEACVQGDLQTVKYLVANGADVGFVGIYGLTALYWACEMRHYQIACYLIRHGADLSVEGTTCLRTSVRRLNLRCLKLLLRYGAAVEDISSTMTPLLYTRSSEHPSKVEFLLCLPLIPRYPLEVLQKLGVSRVDINRQKPYTLSGERRRVEKDRVNGHRVRIVELNRADEQSDNVLEVTKFLDGAVGRPETSSWFNCQEKTVELDPSHEEDDVSMWKMLTAMQRFSSEHTHETALGNVWSYVTLFAHMISNDRPLAYQLVMVVFVLTVKDIEVKTVSMDEIVKVERDFLRYRIVLMSAVNLIFCLLHLKPDMSEEHERVFYRAVYEFIRLGPRGRFGRTPLHMVCHRLPNEFALITSSSIVDVAKLLLDFGADPSAVDDKKNSPLHLVAMLRLVKYDVIDLLLSRGAHFDARNAHRQRFIQLIPEGQRRRYRPGDHLSLQCLAATAIIDHAIPCDILPSSLRQFVNRH